MSHRVRPPDIVLARRKSLDEPSKHNSQSLPHSGRYRGVDTVQKHSGAFSSRLSLSLSVSLPASSARPCSDITPIIATASKSANTVPAGRPTGYPATFITLIGTFLQRLGTMARATRNSSEGEPGRRTRYSRCPRGHDTPCVLTRLSGGGGRPLAPRPGEPNPLSLGFKGKYRTMNIQFCAAHVPDWALVL